MRVELKKVDTKGANNLEKKATFFVRKSVGETIIFSLNDLYSLKENIKKDIKGKGIEIEEQNAELGRIKKQIELLEAELGI